MGSMGCAASRVSKIGAGWPRLRIRIGPFGSVGISVKTAVAKDSVSVSVSVSVSGSGPSMCSSWSATAVRSAAWWAAVRKAPSRTATEPIDRAEAFAAHVRVHELYPVLGRHGRVGVSC